MKPKISIIGTLFDEKHRAERALSIWTRQVDCPPYELIILDDDSADNSGDMVLDYQKKYPQMVRYQYFKHGKQRSCSLLMNYGAQITDGEILVFQWYDRIPASFYLLRDMYNEFIKIKDKAFVSAENGHIGCMYSCRPIPEEKVAELLNGVNWRETPEELLKITNIRPVDNESACFMISKSDFHRLGGYDERYTQVGSAVNIDLYQRCKRDGFTMKTIETPVCHQAHPSMGNRPETGCVFQRDIPDGNIVRNQGIEWGKQNPVVKRETFRTPNKYTHRPALSLHASNVFDVMGYNNYTVSPTEITPHNGNQIHQKYSLLKPLFAEVKGKTVLDLGCSSGFWSILARQNGASKVMAFDIDEAQIDLLAQIAVHYGWDNIEIFRGDYSGWASPADVVLALALIHWVYSCTGFAGSLDHAIASLAQLTQETLIIEWIEPDDSAIQMLKHIEFNKDVITEPYNKKNFLSALNKYFKTVKLIGSVTDKRELYAAQK